MSVSSRGEWVDHAIGSGTVPRYGPNNVNHVLCSNLRCSAYLPLDCRSSQSFHVRSRVDDSICIARLQQETLSKIFKRHPMSYYCSSTPSCLPIAFQLHGASCVSDGPDTERRLYRESSLDPHNSFAQHPLSCHHLPSSSHTSL